MDTTAGQAINHMDRDKHRAVIQSGQARCGKALDRCLAMLKEAGYHIEGYFKVVEDKTGIFLKTKR